MVAVIVPAAGEPVAIWRSVTFGWLVDDLLGRLAPGGMRQVLAVDGRSASGKTTFALRLIEALPDAALVSTDDIAWNESMFGWASLLVDGVLRPFRAGDVVSYRPPAWDRYGRAGSVEIPGASRFLVVEGVGASRAALADWLDQTIWLQSDRAEAERRGIARDIASGVNGDEEATIGFWHAWQAEEVPFLAEDRPWSVPT